MPTLNAILGGFERLEEIGPGAQAKVWKARCVEDRYGIVPKGTIVALKIRNEQGSEANGQFEKLKLELSKAKRFIFMEYFINKSFNKFFNFSIWIFFRNNNNWSRFSITEIGRKRFV